MFFLPTVLGGHVRTPGMHGARQAALHMVPAQGMPKEMVGRNPVALDIWGFLRGVMGCDGL